MKTDPITIERKTFLDLCAAAESARTWLAHNAPCNEWSNLVRTQLNNALQSAIHEKPDNHAEA